MSAEFSRSVRSEKKIDFLYSEKYCDVEFRFVKDGKETAIKAHALFLADASDVFEAMMYGNFDREEKIVIVDVEPETFRSMIKYIYGDRVEVDSINFVMELYTAANKYQIIDLMANCVEYCQSNLNPDCVLRVYEFAHFYKINELIKKTLEYCKNNIMNVISCEEFWSVSVDTLIALFQYGPFDIDDEISLLNAALIYAEAQVDRREEVKRRMGEVFQSIKFANLLPLHYADWMHKNRIALKSYGENYFFETFAKLFYRTERDVELLAENEDKESSREVKIYKVYRSYKSENYANVTNDYGKLSKSLRFCASDFNELIGVQVSKYKQGRSSNIDNIEVTLKNSSGCVIGSTKFSGLVALPILWINFDKPLKIAYNNWYTLLLKFCTQGNYYCHSSSDVFEIIVPSPLSPASTVTIVGESNNDVNLISGLKFGKYVI